MGDARFVYGFIRGGKYRKDPRLALTSDDIVNTAVFQNKAMKCKLHLKVVNADKALMIQRTNAHMQQRSSGGSATDKPTEAVPIPSARELQPDEEWVTITSGDERPMSTQQVEKARWTSGDGIWYI